MTNLSPAIASQVINDALALRYVMLLREGLFASATMRVAVDAGDIFKVHRAGLSENNRNLPCSKERTKEMFTVVIKIGGAELVQFPHEVSPISFLRIMELRATGDLNETYVSTEDNEGHFAPVPKVRDQIRNAFTR